MQCNAMSKKELQRRAPPSVLNKVRRGVWGMTYTALFRYTPISLHGWRRLVLSWFGAQIGRGARIYPSVEIWAPWNFEIGQHATIGGGAKIYSVDRVSIGPSAIISQGAYLCTASHDYQSADFDLFTAPIVVGRNAWVAAEAFIAPGVTINDGAVVVARAVVVKNVPPQEVHGGNPATRIGTRAVSGQNFLR